MGEKPPLLQGRAGEPALSGLANLRPRVMLLTVSRFGKLRTHITILESCSDLSTKRPPPISERLLCSSRMHIINTICIQRMILWTTSKRNNYILKSTFMNQTFCLPWFYCSREDLTSMSFSKVDNSPHGNKEMHLLRCTWFS